MSSSWGLDFTAVAGACGRRKWFRMAVEILATRMRPIKKSSQFSRLFDRSVTWEAGALRGCVSRVVVTGRSAGDEGVMTGILFDGLAGSVGGEAFGVVGTEIEGGAVRSGPWV